MLFREGTATGEAETEAEEETCWAQRADALIHLMADSLTGKSTRSPGDRHQLMVHVSAETQCRLACDGGLVTVLENANGDPLSIGRKTRVIPPSISPSCSSSGSAFNAARPTR